MAGVLQARGVWRVRRVLRVVWRVVCSATRLADEGGEKFVRLGLRTCLPRHYSDGAGPPI